MPGKIVDINTREEYKNFISEQHKRYDKTKTNNKG